MSPQEKYESLLNEIGIAFNKSDIKIKQDNQDVKWNYALCATPIQQNNGLILGINWGGNEREYTIEENMPDGKDIKTYPFMKKSKIFLKDFFDADIELIDFNYSNFCFFRSPKAKELSIKDYDLSIPILKDYINYIKPPWILSLGVTIVGILKNRPEIICNPFEIDGCSQILGYTGKLFGYNYFVLPHPNAQLHTNNRSEIWRVVNPKNIIQ